LGYAVGVGVRPEHVRERKPSISDVPLSPDSSARESASRPWWRERSLRLGNVEDVEQNHSPQTGLTQHEAVTASIDFD